MEEYNEEFLENALENENYLKWRKIHTRMFGEIFSSAFSDNSEAQVHLTAALMNISNRSYGAAAKKLAILENLSITEYDCAVVNYFLGILAELCENEVKTCEYYAKLSAFGISFVFPPAFHPYYRTAKLAARDSECLKAVYYYKKALAFYENREITPQVSSSLCRISYDVATVCLYMHQYGKCRAFLALHDRYAKGTEPEVDYVRAILYATEGEAEAALALAATLADPLGTSCTATVSAILEGRDPHYCLTEVSRGDFLGFWRTLEDKKEKIEKLVLSGNLTAAEKEISDALTLTFPFMKRVLACRVCGFTGGIAVYLKNYCTITLANEYNALLLQKPHTLATWHFISVNGFDRY